MNEFDHLNGTHPAEKPVPDLVDLSLWLSRSPSGPLYRWHVSPDRELAALVAAHVPRASGTGR